MIKHTMFLIHVFYIATRRFFAEKYTFYVSALAFTTLLSIVPLLSVSVFLLTLFPIFSKFIAIADTYILSNLIPSSAVTIQMYLEKFVQQTVHLPILSVIFLIVAAGMMINTIDDTINDIWKVAQRRKRVSSWMVYAVIILVAPVLLGFSVFLTSSIVSLYLFSHITSFLVLVLPLFINTIILSLFYIYAPNTYVRRRDGILAGFLAALLIEAAKFLFALWISYFSTYTLIYGVFSILPIFLVWLYIEWFIILWGVLVTYTLTSGSSHPEVPTKQ